MMGNACGQAAVRELATVGVADAFVRDGCGQLEIPCCGGHDAGEEEDWPTVMEYIDGIDLHTAQGEGTTARAQATCRQRLECSTHENDRSPDISRQPYASCRWRLKVLDLGMERRQEPDSRR